MKLRIRTSSSQFILADDQDMCDAAAVASETSTAEKTGNKLQQGATVNGKGELTVEPMDTEEKQTCNIQSCISIERNPTYLFLGTGIASGTAVEPTIAEQSTVVLVTPEIQPAAGKENRDESPPPKVRCPCGVHEASTCMLYRC